jgi:hypothetical protein
MRRGKEEIIGLAPQLVKLIIKTISFSKGGLSREERRELGMDLLDLAWKVLGEVLDEEGQNEQE